MPSDIPPRWKRLLQPRLLAYIDILGWKELIAAGQDAQVLLAIDAIRYAKRHERTMRRQMRDFGIVVGTTLKTTTLSDSIVLSCAPRSEEIPWLVLQVQLICRFLLATGHYTRGALSLGPVLHRGAEVAGRALLEAYLLERDVAKYPRILVSDTARPLLLSPKLGRRRFSVPLHVRKDFDGLQYLEIVHHWAGRRDQRMRDFASIHADVVRRDIRGTESKRAKRRLPAALNHRAKYSWMLSYLTSVLADPLEPERADSAALADSGDR